MKKRKGKIIESDEVLLENIINLNIQVKQAIKQVYNIKNDKENNHELLIDLIDNNNKNICTLLKVEFKKNNKNYIKDM